MTAVPILSGRRVVITGVLNERSLAFGIARSAQDHGAEIVLTTFERVERYTRRAAAVLGDVPVHQLDVRVPDHFTRLVDDLSVSWGGVDGVVHAIAASDVSCVGEDPFLAGIQSLTETFDVSVFSLQKLVGALRPLLSSTASIVALSFDPEHTWPQYGWMTVAKAALEAEARVLARALGGEGVRVNVLRSGPMKSLAARAFGGPFDAFCDFWSARSPLGWDPRDLLPVGNTAVALLSDLMSATTGEVIHVDGGVHSVGAGDDLTSRLQAVRRTDPGSDQIEEHGPPSFAAEGRSRDEMAGREACPHEGSAYGRS